MSIQTDCFINAEFHGDTQLAGLKVYIVKFFGGPDVSVFNSSEHQRDTKYNISVKENVTDVIIKRNTILTLCEVEVFTGKLYFFCVQMTNFIYSKWKSQM